MSPMATAPSDLLTPQKYAADEAAPLLATTMIDNARGLGVEVKDHKNEAIKTIAVEATTENIMLRAEAPSAGRACLFADSGRRRCSRLRACA